MPKVYTVRCEKCLERITGDTPDDCGKLVAEHVLRCMGV